MSIHGLDDTTRGMIAVDVPNSNYRNHRSYCDNKIFWYALSIICGISGLGMVGVGLYGYIQGKIPHPEALLAVGAGALGFSFFVVYVLKKQTRVDIGVQNRLPTGEELLNRISPNRPDPTTIEGACKTLGISLDQRHDRQLIEKNKNAIVREMERVINGLLKQEKNMYEKVPIEKRRSSFKESPLVQATRIEIKEAEIAYDTLMKHSSESK